MENHSNGDCSQDDALKEEDSDDEGNNEETITINTPYVFTEVVLAKTVGEYHSINHVSLLIKAISQCIMHTPISLLMISIVQTSLFLSTNSLLELSHPDMPWILTPTSSISLYLLCLSSPAKSQYTTRSLLISTHLVTYAALRVWGVNIFMPCNCGRKALPNTTSFLFKQTQMRRAYWGLTLLKSASSLHSSIIARTITVPLLIDSLMLAISLMPTPGCGLSNVTMISIISKSLRLSTSMLSCDAHIWFACMGQSQPGPISSLVTHYMHFTLTMSISTWTIIASK